MDLKQFGEELRTLRKVAQWSGEELIQALDQLAHLGPSTDYRVIDATLLSRWEHGRIQNGRQWKPTRAYALYLIRVFAPYLDLARAQQWAALAGYQITPGELEAWFVSSPGIQQEPVADSPAFPHNLPTSLTSFVGREAEIARLVEYLVNPSTRLVTLVGEGGVGKTRLSLQVAQTIVNKGIGPFSDGVYFVSLAGVNDANSVVSALADALTIALAASDDPEQLLFSHLRHRQYLLVLDNFEQVVTSVTPLITSILQAAPGIHLLVTSRMRLNLAEEWIVALSGLAFPAMAATPGHGDHNIAPFPLATMTEEYGAIELFMARARQVDAHFGDENDPMQGVAIARICGLLHGIPLGIEMAAAWVHMLSCVEIGDQIAQSLDFLTSPHRNAPERHRSMRAIFEYSWRLLSRQEQDVMAALALFRGTFTVDAATNVTGASLLTLRSLVDKSLLKFTEGRYELHELLRHFAEEQSQPDSDKYTVTATRHSAYYLRFVAARELRLAGQEAQEAAGEIIGEFTNIRHAWSWAATHLHLDELESSLYALWRFYLLNGSSSEGEQLLRLAIEQINIAGTTLRQRPFVRPFLSKLLTMRANFLFRQGYSQQALRLSEEAIAIAESSIQENGADYQFRVVKALALWQKAFVFIDVGELEKAQVVLEEGLQLIERDEGDANSRAMASDLEWQQRLLLAYVYLDAGNYSLAREHVEYALATCQSSGKVRGQVTGLANLGWIELQAGNYDGARQAYEQALPLSRALGYRLEEAANLIELGDTVRLQGEYGPARQYLERGWSLAHEINAHKYANYAVESFTYLYCHLGAYQLAQEWFNRWHATDEDTKGTKAFLQAMLAHLQGADQQALDAATRAWQSANKSGSRDDKAKTLVILAHIQADLQRSVAATDTYGQALALYRAMGKPALAVEAQAGLADVALNSGDVETARQHIEAILPVLAEASYTGINEPFYIYWVCYRLLTAIQDDRAAPLLESAYRRLQKYAEKIGDETLVHSFWEKVALHRNLAAAYLQSHHLADGVG